MTEEIAALVRQWDRPRYLSLLFAPDDRRPDLMVLHAFNAEICRIPVSVSEPHIGEIRLQWWREALAAMGRGQAQDHPIAAALADVVARQQLPINPLFDIVEAHVQDLYAEPMSNRTALEEYLGNTQSILIQLSAMILDRAAAPKVADAAGFAGVAYGLCQILAFPKRHSNLMPKEETHASLAQLARARLQQARACTIPASLRPAFHHVALTELFLARSGHPPGALRLQFELWRAARRNFF